MRKKGGIRSSEAASQVFSSDNGSGGRASFSRGLFSATVATLSAEWTVALKKMGKKDAVTKLKGLAELSTLQKDAKLTDEELAALARMWALVFPGLAEDGERRVREQAAEHMGRIAAPLRRNMRAILPEVAFSWVLLQYDDCDDVRQAAIHSWESSVPVARRPELAAEIAPDVLRGALQEVAKPMSDERARVHAAAVRALQYVVADAPPSAELDAALAQALSTQALDGLFSHRSDVVRSAAYEFGARLVDARPDLASTFLAKVVRFAWAALDEPAAAAHTSMWRFVLTTARFRSGAAFAAVDARKAFLPRLWRFLDDGCRGSESVSYPCLLTLVAALPEDLAVPRVYDAWLSHLLAPLQLDLPQTWTLPYVPSALAPALVRAVAELFAYVLQRHQSAAHYVSELQSLLNRHAPFWMARAIRSDDVWDAALQGLLWRIARSEVALELWPLAWRAVTADGLRDSASARRLARSVLADPKMDGPPRQALADVWADCVETGLHAEWILPWTRLLLQPNPFDCARVSRTLLHCLKENDEKEGSDTEENMKNREWKLHAGARVGAAWVHWEGGSAMATLESWLSSSTATAGWTEAESNRLMHALAVEYLHEFHGRDVVSLLSSRTLQRWAEDPHSPTFHHTWAEYWPWTDVCDALQAGWLDEPSRAAVVAKLRRDIDAPLVQAQRLSPDVLAAIRVALRSCAGLPEDALWLAAVLAEGVRQTQVGLVRDLLAESRAFLTMPKSSWRLLAQALFAVSKDSSSSPLLLEDSLAVCREGLSVDCSTEWLGLIDQMLAGSAEDELVDAALAYWRLEAPRWMDRRERLAMEALGPWTLDGPLAYPVVVAQAEFPFAFPATAASSPLQEEHSLRPLCFAVRILTRVAHALDDETTVAADWWQRSWLDLLLAVYRSTGIRSGWHNLLQDELKRSLLENTAWTQLLVARLWAALKSGAGRSLADALALRALADWAPSFTVTPLLQAALNSDAARFGAIVRRSLHGLSLYSSAFSSFSLISEGSSNFQDENWWDYSNGWIDFQSSSKDISSKDISSKDISSISSSLQLFEENNLETFQSYSEAHLAALARAKWTHRPNTQQDQATTAVDSLTSNPAPERSKSVDWIRSWPTDTQPCTYGHLALALHVARAVPAHSAGWRAVLGWLVRMALRMYRGGAAALGWGSQWLHAFAALVIAKIPSVAREAVLLDCAFSDEEVDLARLELLHPLPLQSQRLLYTLLLEIPPVESNDEEASEEKPLDTNLEFSRRKKRTPSSPNTNVWDGTVEEWEREEEEHIAMPWPGRFLDLLQRGLQQMSEHSSEGERRALLAGYVLFLQCAGKAGTKLRELMTRYAYKSGLVAVAMTRIFELQADPLPETFGLHSVARTLFSLQSLEVKEKDENDDDDKEDDDDDDEHHLPTLDEVGGWAVELSLRHMPSIVRGWRQMECTRVGTAVVDAFVVRHVAPTLIRDEMAAAEAQGQGDDVLRIEGRPSTREIAAEYRKDDTTLELVVSIPPSYPLHNVKFAFTRRMGVSEPTWKRWQLSMGAFFLLQDGHIADAIRLWRSSLDKLFEGTEPCPICYELFSASDRSLPKLACRTCRYKFHSPCLYKWVKTSHNTTCPMCRSPFA